MILSKIQNSKFGRRRGRILNFEFCYKSKYWYLAKFKIQNSTAAAVEFRILNFGIKLNNGPPPQKKNGATPATATFLNLVKVYGRH